ncbi:hypothetical protein VNO77_20208 [Canavalia gladiata]|uniref:Uncharacterized protein n=1 Tax=Canavalia gladiata TaxID=3824 RepID=A0AAN9LSD4_CANGL
MSNSEGSHNFSLGPDHEIRPYHLTLSFHLALKLLHHDLKLLRKTRCMHANKAEENVVLASKLALALAHTMAGGSDLSYQPYSSTLDHTVWVWDFQVDACQGSGGRIVHAWSIVMKMRWPGRAVILVHTRVGDRSLHVECSYVQRADTYGLG